MGVRAFGEELREAGAELLARLGGHRAGSWIVEHWLMIDRRLVEGETPSALYARQPALSDDDRDCAARIAASRTGIFRVVGCQTGVGMDLEDMATGSRLRVESTSVSQRAAPGDALIARAMDGSPKTLWGPARVLTPRHAAMLFDHLRTVGDIRSAWPELMTYEPPRMPLLVATADWDIDDDDAVFEALPDAFEYRGDDDGAEVFEWRIGPREADLGGLLWLYRDGLVLGTYAQSLLDEAADLIDGALGDLARPAGRGVHPLQIHARRAA